MKKMEYRRPTADLILFENEDIIMTSVTEWTEGGYDKGNGHWLWFDDCGNVIIGAFGLTACSSDDNLYIEVKHPITGEWTFNGDWTEIEYPDSCGEYTQSHSLGG